MAYIVTIKDVRAKCLKLQDTNEEDPDDTDEDEIYSLGFIWSINSAGDFREQHIIKKSSPVEFKAEGEEHWLDSSGVRDLWPVNNADGDRFFVCMILMEEDTGTLSDEVESAIDNLVKSVLPHANSLPVVDSFLEASQAENSIIFIGAFVDWAINIFNSDDYLGKASSNLIDASNLLPGASIEITVRETLEAGNAKYKLMYTVNIKSS